ARGDAPRHASHARGDPRLRAPDRPAGRDEAGRRDPRRQGGDPVPRRPVRDARAALDEPGLVPLRGVLAPERRAHADREGAHRPLPGAGPLHDRLMAMTSADPAAERFPTPAGFASPAGVTFRHLRAPDDFPAMNEIANAYRRAVGMSFTTTDE